MAFSFRSLFFYSSFLIFVLLIHPIAHAQISPPGLDNTNTVLWGSVGIDQNFGKKWFSRTYAGGSRFSDPNNMSLLKKQAIYVIEQQTYRTFNKHWQLGFCISLRGQNMYSEDPPYDSEIPSLRREIRYYMRLYYRHQVGKLSFAYSLRPEWRNFYSPDWSNYYTQPKGLRYRAKAQVSIPLNVEKTNSLIFMNELLFVEKQKRQPNGSLAWTPFALSEDRICVYFRHEFEKEKITFDIGVMQQLNFTKGVLQDDFVHFAFDILFIDPFTKRK